MLVKDLMTKSVITVKPDMLISEVAELLHQHHFTGVPVVNDEGVVLGTISERDFITADSNLYLPTYIKLLSGMDYLKGSEQHLPHVVKQIVNATARDIMNKDAPFANPEMTLEQLALIFAEKRANPVPVTDSSNHILGIISRSDLIKFFSPTQVATAYVPERQLDRPIDREVQFLSKKFSTSFAIVAKARANIWLTTAIVLFIVGFIAGIIYVADPNIFIERAPVVPNSGTLNIQNNLEVLPEGEALPVEEGGLPNPEAEPVQLQGSSSANPSSSNSISPVVKNPPTLPGETDTVEPESFDELDRFLNQFDNP